MLKSNVKMNSNLPLIFANGFPTSIDKITIKQLQKFIPFLVQCSLGSVPSKHFYKPEWWPQNIPLITPNTKPICSEAKWLAILRRIVLKCYHYHGCDYLVTFCNELTQYDQNDLRFINNFNGTTSIHVKGRNKLLCTFRNENINYDRVEEDSRKYLKPRIVNVIKILDDEDDNDMVTTETVDVFICEVCNMESESFADMQEHELVCGLRKEVNLVPENVIHQGQTNFLNYFKLSSNKNTSNNGPVKPPSPVKFLLNNTRRTRGYCALTRSRIIPFSSPAGQVLLKTANAEKDDEETLADKLVKLEKMCPAPDANVSMPKFMNPNYKIKKTYKITYKKKPNDYVRLYQFPIGHALSTGKCDDEKYLEKYLDKSQIRTANMQLTECQNEQVIENIIDLCSSDEEDSSDSKSSDKMQLQSSGSILQNMLNASQELEINKNSNSDVEMPEVSITINGSPTVCKISQFLYAQKSSKKDGTDCIDLCSSDEETILPDLPNYPHLTMIRIPVGSSAMS